MGARRPPNTPLILAGPVTVGLQAPGLGHAGIGLLTRGAGKKVAAQGGRSSLGLSTQTSSTRKVAQTGRVTFGISGDATPTFVSVAGSYTHITITRDYDLADGASPIGVVYFTLSAWLLNNKVTLVPAPVGAALDSNGAISISLAANTDPGTTPVGSYYTVREAIVGQPDRTYKVSVPTNAGLSVDLATLPVIP